MSTSFSSVAARVGFSSRTRGPAAALTAAAMAAALGSVSAPVFGQSLDAPVIEKRVRSIAGFTTLEMLSRLNQPWVQLIDVRPAQEYAGSDVRALRGGHIPGAINLPLERGQAEPATAEHTSADRRLDATKTLPPRLAGLDPDKETIVYGNDAADAAGFAQLLERNGFRQVRLYAPGWPGWANALELPVANERFADVGSLRRQIDELQRTVDRYAARRGDGEPIAGTLQSATR